jgi:hypothetical protein
MPYFHNPETLSGLFQGKLGQYLTPAKPQQVIMNYVIPDEDGLITIALQPLVRTFDGRDVRQLSTTVKLVVEPDKRSSLGSILDKAHDWALRAFFEFASEEMQSSWNGE